MLLLTPLPHKPNHSVLDLPLWVLRSLPEQKINLRVCHQEWALLHRTRTIEDLIRWAHSELLVNLDLTKTRAHLEVKVMEEMNAIGSILEGDQILAALWVEVVRDLRLQRRPMPRSFILRTSLKKKDDNRACYNSRSNL